MNTDREKNKIVNLLKDVKIIAMMAPKTIEEGVKVCEVLQKAGIKSVEMTFRTPAAAETIKEICTSFPDLLVGAGTILNIKDLESAASAGAKFGVAPGCNPKIVKHARKMDFPFFPGIATPTDIDFAYHELGCTVQKLFPAEALGGVKLLKSIIAPFKHLGIKYIPTGGINSSNFKSYFDIADVIAVGGTWLIPKDAVEAKDWNTVEKVAKDALKMLCG